MQKESKKAVIYARYSSAGQREASIEDQIRDCKGYASRKNYSVIGEYYDKAMTGTNDRRPDFQRMIADSASGLFDVVIVWKLDRFGRNRYDSASYRHKLKKNGVTIESAMEAIPDGAEGIILESLLEGISEYYSASLSENVRRGIHGSALKHQVLGQRVFGLREAADGTFEKNPETAPIVEEIFNRYVAGESAKSITADLTARGYKSMQGRPLGREFVVRIIKNEKYKGIYKYQDVCDKCIDPIVSDELWEAAQKVCRSHREAPAALKEDGGYMLTGILRCGWCGAPMRSYSGTSRDGTTHKYYACGNAVRKQCNCPKYKKQFLEDVTAAALNKIIFTDEIIDQYADSYLQWQAAQPKTSDKAATRLVEADRQIRNIVNAISLGNAPQSLIDRLRELEAEKEELIAIHSKAVLEEGRQFTRAEVIDWFHSFRDGDISDPFFFASTLEMFVVSITIMPDNTAIVQLRHSGAENTISIEAMRELPKGVEILCSNSEDVGRPNVAKPNTITIEGKPCIVFRF